MAKIFNYKIKELKKRDYIWIILGPIIFIILYKANYTPVAMLFLHLTILVLYLKQIIKLIKTTGLWLRITFAEYSIKDVVKSLLYDDPTEEGWESRVTFKNRIKSIRLCASIYFSSALTAIGMKHLMYTYSDFNLENVIPTYTLTLTLLLLLGRRSDTRYIELYNLRLKLKKSLENIN